LSSEQQRAAPFGAHDINIVLLVAVTAGMSECHVDSVESVVRM
jgi:hypothetical protein